MRIHELPLSKKFGSHNVVHALQDLGIPVKSPSSHVDALPPLFMESLYYMVWERQMSEEALRALKDRLALQERNGW